MLNADDDKTIKSLNLLRRVVTESTRPVVFWIGAGTGSWLGYPLWKELARQLKRHFTKYVTGLNRTALQAEMDSGDFPAFFQMCKDLDSKQYYDFLSKSFPPMKTTVEYAHFIDLVQRLEPFHIVTTNVDEALESRLRNATVLQTTNLPRSIDLLNSRASFIAKLHGSSSAIEDAVFAKGDYDALLQIKGYLSSLNHLFLTCTVIFLGYSVRDTYVLKLLADNVEDTAFFGTGPHFVTTTTERHDLSSLHQISYDLRRHPDHRAAMTVLDYVWQAKLIAQTGTLPIEISDTVQQPVSSPKPSIYYISDFKPPGTWHDFSAASILSHDTGATGHITIGLGFTNEEIPSAVTTAPHDLVVGLICFDYVYLPLIAASALFQLVGEELLKRILEEDVVRFLHTENEMSAIFAEGEVLGVIDLIQPKSMDGLQPQSPSEVISRHFSPKPGQEEPANKILQDMESKVIIFKDSVKLDIAPFTRNCLLMPGISRLLGIGEAILPSQVPIWLKFPYLRLAHLVHTGVLCDKLNMIATKLPFGGVQLTTAAFGIRIAQEWSDEYASYAVTRNFNSDLGTYVLQQPQIISSILQFRRSSEGEALRKEVKEQLLSHEGTEFATSVNAGLRRNIPMTVLQRAHDKLAILMTTSGRAATTSAVWSSRLLLDDTTYLWRKKALQTLLDLCREKGITQNDPCVCGSGDKLYQCCMFPLNQ
ncbi:MAG TPA: SIR2 family protein [Terriglobales bacterium]|jgi:hypothetical protein|nr:SIR2 family protein [Terriglobales bacterium]